MQFEKSEVAINPHFYQELFNTFTLTFFLLNHLSCCVSIQERFLTTWTTT